MPESWDLEADVVVIGAGATGLPAAIAARDTGVSVIVVEANYDIGGHAILSGGNVPLGGGTSAQRKYGIEDSPDTVFADLTDWSIVQPNGWPDYRYNDRAVMRAARRGRVGGVDGAVPRGGRPGAGDLAHHGSGTDPPGPGRAAASPGTR